MKTLPGFITAEKVSQLSTKSPERLFPPFAQSIATLLDVLLLNSGLTSDAQNAKIKNRMDFNEADHPRDENGRFAESASSSSGSSKSGPAASPEGKNAACTGSLLRQGSKIMLAGMALKKWKLSRKKNTSRKASTF